jgi:hypothetical protein
MKAFDFSVPTRVFFGAGELKRLKEVSPGLGKKAMLLAAKQTMKQTGILDRAADLLRQGGVEVVVSDARGDVPGRHRHWDLWSQGHGIRSAGQCPGVGLPRVPRVAGHDVHGRGLAYTISVGTTIVTNLPSAIFTLSQGTPLGVPSLAWFMVLFVAVFLVLQKRTLLGK